MNKKQWLPLWAWGVIVITVLIFSLFLEFAFWAGDSWVGNGSSYAISGGITLAIINIVLWLLYARDSGIKKELEKSLRPVDVVTPVNIANKNKVE